MNRLQWYRLISILGAFLVGFWLPIRMIGYKPPFLLEVFFDILISVISFLNIYLYFQKTKYSYSKLKSWMNLGVCLDLICLIPLSFFAFILFEDTVEWILFLNLFAARHVKRIKDFLEQFDNLKPITYRLIPVFIALPLLVHLVACGWIALGSGTIGPDPDKVLEYVRAMYWAFTTLTTVGYGDISAKSIPQMLYACGTQVMGVGVFGFILSNVASLLARMDAAREHHMDNLDKIENFMNMHQIPESVKTKTRNYFHYIWINKKGYSDRSLIESLPHKLQSDLFFSINKNIIDKVPFFQGAKKEMIEDLMHELEPRIYVPGEKIFRINEPGDALYFVQSGKVDIISRDGEKVATLHDGAFFGEMALLSDRPRSATAISTTYCDTYCLSKQAFERVVKVYPEFKEHVENVMKERSR